MKSWLAGAVGAYLLGCATALAQNPDAPAITKRLDKIAKSYPEEQFMGSVLVVEGDHTLLDKGYGMADLKRKIPDSPDAQFRLGSLTKQFTAALILLLQQDGKLQVADPVSKYLDDAPQTWKKITLANLLGHTSGIPNFTSDPAFRTWSLRPHSHAEEIGLFRDKPLEFAPGSRYEYSNSNYEVLGAVIEKVSGRDYGELLRERIFEPLEMKNSGLDADGLILPRRAQGYRDSKDWGLAPAQSESMTIPWAAGSIYSTTGDLLRWEHGLFGGKILNDASLQAMTTAGKGNYGLGVEVAQMHGVKVVSHNGGIEGFNTYLCYVPERQITVVVLSNVNGTAPDTMGPELLNAVLATQ